MTFEVACQLSVKIVNYNLNYSFILGFQSTWIWKIFIMATKMVVQQPKPLLVAAASDQWNTSICECDNVNECEFVCVYMLLWIFEYKLRIR